MEAIAKGPPSRFSVSLGNRDTRWFLVNSVFHAKTTLGQQQVLYSKPNMHGKVPERLHERLLHILEEAPGETFGKIRQILWKISRKNYWRSSRSSSTNREKNVWRNNEKKCGWNPAWNSWTNSGKNLLNKFRKWFLLQNVLSNAMPSSFRVF